MRSACNTSTPNISCTPAATAYVQAWVQEISSFVKTIDSNHLLTTGEEGFYAQGPEATQLNPGQLFAVGSGQDFVQNHNLPSIDYAVTHIWVGELFPSLEICIPELKPQIYHTYPSLLADRPQSSKASQLKIYCQPCLARHGSWL